MNKIFKYNRGFFLRATTGILLLFLSFAAIRAERHERLIESWQPLHFDIKLSFDSSISQINSATADVTVLVHQNNVSMIDFDFGTMPISAVKVDNQPARFAYHDNKLDVYLSRPAQQNQKLIVSVSYSGKPQDGLILTKDKDGNPSAVGDNWADRVHNWIPCFDHPSAKASVRFTVTASSNNAVVANGTLESVKNNPDATKTWIYSERKNVSPYNMVVAIGQFANAVLKAKSPVPISYYVQQSDKQFAEQGFSSATPSMITFNNLVAPYPYGKLALVIGATRYGGMENANTIVFPPTLFRNFLEAKSRGQRYNIPSGVEEVVAHEIAHQWFGDSVTESTWADLWLSEGFATYFAGIFLERNESELKFRSYMKEKGQQYLTYEKTRRAPLHDTETENLFDLLNANSYQKGGWVLHMTRGVIGDKAFFAGIRIYYNAHRESTASSEDLRAAMEKASGKNLKSFFDRWVYKSGHPVYQISSKALSPGNIEITLKQLQDDEAFTQPVTVEIISNRGKRRITITPDSKETTIKIKSAKPNKIIVDPDDFILKEVRNNDA